MLPETAPSIESVGEFARVLRLGLGRAILFLRQHDPTPYRDAILDACLHYTGYDWQVEGTRTTYLYDVLQATGNADAFVTPILAALHETRDFRDADQMVRLAAWFAEDGREDARAALYATFEHHSQWDPFGPSSYREPFLGYGSIIDVDGLDGFLHVADRMGAALLEEPPAMKEDDRWLFGSARSIAEEVCGNDRIRQALEQAASENPRIRAYAEALAAEEAEEAEQSTASRDRPTWGAIPYEQIRQAIVGVGPLRASSGGLRTWGRDAPDADVNRAAADLLVEEDEERLVRYLHMFYQRRFPRQIDRLLELVRHPNDRLMHAATNALSNVADPRVRALALEIIADDSLHGWRKSGGVDLLLSSWQPGDEVLLTRLLESPRDEVEYHWIGYGALDVLKAHLSVDAVPPLLALYERGPCTQCRHRIVELLEQLGRLPGWMLTECHYDASLRLRETAEKIDSGRPSSR